MMALSGSVKFLCAFPSGSPQARLYGRPPLGLRPCSGSRPRASSASRCSASKSLLAARIAANRPSRRRSSSGTSSPRNGSPKRSSSCASVSRARVGNAPIPASDPCSLRSIRPQPVALRLPALARIFVPSTDSFPKPANPILRTTRTTSTNRPLKSSG